LWHSSTGSGSFPGIVSPGFLNSISVQEFSNVVTLCEEFELTTDRVFSVEIIAPDNLGKAEEIRLLETILRELPEGYLRDILQDSAFSICTAIKNDFCAIEKDYAQEIEELKSERAALTEENKRLRAQGESMAGQIRQADRRIREGEELARTLRRTVETIREF
jgi:hypothetical protein